MSQTHPCRSVFLLMCAVANATKESFERKSLGLRTTDSDQLVIRGKVGWEESKGRALDFKFKRLCCEGVALQWSSISITRRSRG